MKKNSFTLRDVFNLLALLSLALIFTAGLVAFNWWIARQYGTGADFLPAWNGARAFLFERTEPYSLTVTQQTQVEIYGHAAGANEFPYALDIPFPFLLLYCSPLFLYRGLTSLVSLLHLPGSSFPAPDSGWTLWVRAIWMLLSEIGLLGIVTFALRLTDWRPPRWFMLVLLGFALTWFFSVAALLDASLSILVVLALLGALAALRDFHDEAAGILLAVAAMRWEATLLLWLFILWGAYSSRRWRVFAGMGMTWFILAAISFLIYPTWVWPWLRAVAMNWRADDILTPARFFALWFPKFGARLVSVIVAILLLGLALEWIGTLRSRDFRRVTWVAALSLALTPLLGMSTTFANLAPLVFSFIVILPFAWERWKKYSYLVLLLFCIVFFAFPLVIRWQLRDDVFLADGLIYLLLPILTLLALYWMRWYVVRPPTTWLDGVRRELRK